METKNVPEIIKDMTNISQSQKDRYVIKMDAFNDMMGFLTGYIDKVKGVNSLRSRAEDLLDKKLETAQELKEEIPYGVLIKIIETAAKTEVDQVTPLLKIIEAMVKAQNEKPTEGTNPDGTSVTNDQSHLITETDIKKTKSLLDFISKLEKSEGIETK
jgi:hypothetical protein